MKIKNIFPFAIIMLYAACTEEVQQQKTNQLIPLKLEAVNDAVITRGSTDLSNIQGNVFDEGEFINAYISVTGASDGTTSLGNPLEMKASAAQNGVNTLSPKNGSTLYFPPGDNVKVDIYAHYPTSVLSSLPFSVGNLQISEDEYKKSDLMYASASSPKTDQPIHLQFTHKMAKLVINASGEEGVTMNKITLKTLYTAINWDSSTGMLSTEESGLSERKDIIIANSNEYTASLKGVALFPPQTTSPTGDVYYFAEVECKTMNGTLGTAHFYVAPKQFEEGKVYTVNVKIGPKNLEEDGKVTIAPWPSTVGTVDIEAVGNLGLEITNLVDDGNNETNTMTVSGLTGYYTYNGKPCTPKPTVTDGKEGTNATILTEEDYDITYYNNLNAGTALIVISGKREYEGLSTFTTFNIKKATNDMHYEISPSISVNLSKGAIVDNQLVLPSFQANEVYGKITYKIYSDAGMTNDVTTSNGYATVDENGNIKMVKKTSSPLYIKATMDDTGNFESSTSSYALTITAGDITRTISIAWNDGKEDGAESWEFTGTNIKPGFRILDNGNTLAGKETSGGTDYNYTFSDNILVGSNTAKLTITGQGEYSGTKVFYFTITQANNEWITLNRPNVPIDCGDSKSNPQGTRNVTLSIAAETFAITGVPKFGTGTNYTGTSNDVTYRTEDASIATVNTTTGLITAVGIGSTKIHATVGGTANYKVLETTIDVTVEKMTRIFVYNGTTEAFTHLNSDYTTKDGTTDKFWYAQVRGGSAQECNLSFTENATVYALLVGAGGGSDNVGRGGSGGYVYASKTYDKGTTAQYYVWCGGGGQSECNGNNTSSTIRTDGGWPGGGKCGTVGRSGAGGGATVVATSNSTADWTFGASDTRLLVAGAGGGSSNGGNGGENAGVAGDKVGTMKDCTSGREKWKGGRCNTTGEISQDRIDYDDGGGGGAGYYGGFGGQEASGTAATGGHGGSNYIHPSWNSSLNKSGTANDSQTFNDIGFTMEKNGHPVLPGSTYTAPEYNYRVYPGYVIIKYKYNR